MPYYNGRHGFLYTHTCGLTFASVRKAVWSIVCIISIAFKNNWAVWISLIFHKEIRGLEKGNKNEIFLCWTQKHVLLAPLGLELQDFPHKRNEQDDLIWPIRFLDWWQMTNQRIKSYSQEYSYLYSWQSIHPHLQRNKLFFLNVKQIKLNWFKRHLIYTSLLVSPLHDHNQLNQTFFELLQITNFLLSNLAWVFPTFSRTKN